MKLCSIILFVSLFSLSTFAAETRVRSESRSPTEVNVTASIGTIDGDFATGPGLQVLWPFDVNGSGFLLGFQTGIYFIHESAGNDFVNIHRNVWSFPLLAAGEYKIPTRDSNVKPYAGISLGLSIDHFGSFHDNDDADPTIGGGHTDVNFAFQIRPGCTFGDQQRWFVELPFGVLADEFSFLPTLGYHF